MFLKSAEKILERVKNHPTVIVGAGAAGRELALFLIKGQVNIISFFDNNEWLTEKKIYNIPIQTPRRNEEKRTVYVVAVRECFREELTTQLSELGIPRDAILTYHPSRELSWMIELDRSEYQEELTDMFRERIGYDMNWDEPKTYNEIINWEKLNGNNEVYSILADKCQARNWVKHKIGSDHLVRRYGEWDAPEKIPFSELPNKFMLKLNNGSGMNMAVHDKSVLNIESAIKEMKRWMNNQFAYLGLELHYMDIVPQIICEELLDTNKSGFFDCKLYCFHGEPKYIQCIRDEHMPNMRARIYDTEWAPQDFNHGYPDDPETFEKPRNMDDIIRLSKELCRDFRHVRVDWYVLPNGDFYFAEMTFSSWAGFVRFSPDKYDDLFGRLIIG